MVQLFPKKSRSDSSSKKPKHHLKFFQHLKGGDFHVIDKLLVFLRLRTGADDITITNDDKTDFVAGDDKAEPTTDERLIECDNITIANDDKTDFVAGDDKDEPTDERLTECDNITIANDDKTDFVAGDDKGEPTDERLTECDRFSLTPSEKEIINDHSKPSDDEIMTGPPGIFLTHTDSTTVTLARRGSSSSPASKSIGTSRNPNSLEVHAYGHSGRNSVVNHYSNLEEHPNAFYGAKITGGGIVQNSFNGNHNCHNFNVSARSYSRFNGQTYFHWQQNW